MYYVLSPTGEKQGPYPISDLKAWFSSGQLPTNSRLIDFNSGKEMTLGEVLAPPKPTESAKKGSTANPPLDQTNYAAYPRANALNVESSPTKGDKVVGIILIVLQCISVLGLLFAVFGGAALRSLTPQGNSQILKDSLGPLSILLSVVKITVWTSAGIGILQGKKWGFLMAYATLIVALLSVLHSLLIIQGPFRFLLVSAFIFPGLLSLYAFLRLSGRSGPTPLD